MGGSNAAHGEVMPRWERKMRAEVFECIETRDQIIADHKQAVLEAKLAEERRIAEEERLRVEEERLEKERKAKAERKRKADEAARKKRKDEEEREASRLKKADEEAAAKKLADEEEAAEKGDATAEDSMDVTEATDAPPEGEAATKPAYSSSVNATSDIPANKDDEDEVMAV